MSLFNHRITVRFAVGLTLQDSFFCKVNGVLNCFIKIDELSFCYGYSTQKRFNFKGLLELEAIEHRVPWC